MRRLAATLILVVLGCSDPASSYSLSIDVRPLGTAVEQIGLLEITLGSPCAQQTGPGVPSGLQQQWIFERPERVAPLGAVAEGSFGLVGRALSDQCGVIGYGCVDFTFERGGVGVIELLISPVTSDACVPGEGCPCTPDPPACEVEAGCTVGTSPGRCILGESGAAECCTGCLDRAGQCQSGTTAASCGVGGDSCTACAGSESCVGGTCSCTPGTTCQVGGTGARGVCRLGGDGAGTCCTGCWDGASQVCQGGNDAEACGAEGQACATCGPSESCTDGVCGCEPGSPCTTALMAAGTCWPLSQGGSACCAGCWDGPNELCRQGSTAAFCGSGGALCESCRDFCFLGQCLDCMVGEACLASSGDPGRCYDNGGSAECCAGCWDDVSGVCRPGEQDAACGADGALCMSCARACSGAGVCG